MSSREYIKGNCGVRFMMNKHLEKNLKEFKGISKRIAVLNVNLPGYENKKCISRATR